MSRRSRTLTGSAALALTIAAAAAAGLFAGSAGARAATSFTVTSTADTDTAGTLRHAINLANANDDEPTQDAIVFNIAGDGPHTITATGSEPVITEPLLIDGYTQGDQTVATTDDAAPNSIAQGSSNAILKISLDGSAASGFTNGLTTATSDVTIRGLNIHSFSGAAIRVDDASTGTELEGNFLGTNVAGTAAGTDPDTSSDVAILTNPSQLTIGGTTPEARNVISGAQDDGAGIAFASGGGNFDVAIQGNLIGVAKDGNTAVPNGVGIVVRATPDSGMVIGGRSSGAGNVIAGNTQEGITMINGNGDASFLSNEIAFNGGLGIDLADNGVTENDPKDADGALQANHLQNFPVLTSAEITGGEMTVKGKLASRKNRKYLVQIFASADPDPSGNGEGEEFLGDFKVKTNKKGKVKLNTEVPAPDGGQPEITATATDRKTNETSEFSDVVEAVF